jgi:hypothetical protein
MALTIVILKSASDVAAEVLGIKNSVFQMTIEITEPKWREHSLNLGNESEPFFVQAVPPSSLSIEIKGKITWETYERIIKAINENK